MTYFRVDDQFALHPKAIAAGNAALGLWVRAGSWCSAHLTDGALPAHMVGTLGAQRRDAARLVSCGLWATTDVGYQFNNWQDYQPTKTQVSAEKEAARERQRRWREARSNAVSNGVTDAVTTPVSNGVSNAAHSFPFHSSSGVKDHLSVPDRTRPSDGPDLAKIAKILGTDETWASKVATQVLDRAPANVRNPTAYVEQAIREKPEDYRPTRLPPRLGDLCPEHGRERATCPRSWHEVTP